MTDVSSVIEELWGMFTDLFYLTLQKYDEIVIFHTFDGDPVSLLDTSVIKSPAQYKFYNKSGNS